MRTCLVYFADMAKASVTAGRIMFLKVISVEMTWSHCNFTQKKEISRSPTQKFGTDTPRNVNPRITLSIHLFLFTAASIPKGMESASIKIMANSASFIVGHNLEPKRSSTGFFRE